MAFCKGQTFHGLHSSIGYTAGSSLDPKLHEHCDTERRGEIPKLVYIT
jgi:hypothetical protein